ncbi:MAG: LLM class F420-dependent oxidoreductase [Acidimicrobiia bacterium]
MDLGTFGIWRRIGQLTEAMAVAAEELGYGAIWIGGSPPGDLDVVEMTLEATEQIPVVTGIVNMWREDASTVARSYHRIVDKHPGRFLLGVGVGHPEATAGYRRPLDKINDYLDGLEKAGVPGDQIVLAALGPKALGIAAERTAGAHPYLTTPRHTAMAREIMGQGPLLAPEHKVILGADPESFLEQGRAVVQRYLRLDNYRRNLRREGWDQADLADGGSDRLIRALVLGGGPAEVADALRAHIDAGADHVGIQALGEKPDEAYRLLAGALLG